MKASKIGSANTYIRCLKELDNWGYLKYNPSYNPQKGSQVYLYSLDKAADKGGDKGTDNATHKTTDTASNNGIVNGSDKGTDNAAIMPVIPSINNNINSINNTNNLNERKTQNQNKSKKNSPSNSKSDEIFQKKSSTKSKTPLPEKRKKEKLRQKKNAEPLASASGEVPSRHPELVEGASVTAVSKITGPPTPGFQRPLLLEVQNYFKEKSWPPLEAEKYFNHYQSNGWLVAGKTPMVDWQASAAKWMLNVKDFKSSQPPSLLEKGGGLRLNATTNKNYNEPL
jgi:hypothetical protein